MAVSLESLDEKKLAAIEANALRLAKAKGPGKEAAEQMLADIKAERHRRKEAASTARMAKAVDITLTVKDMAYYDRVYYAFTDVPPVGWEVEVLKEIALHPGSTGTDIALAIGKMEVGYINLAVGTICSTREPYLGLAPKNKGVKHFSALIIDFRMNTDAEGSKAQGWTLKPEAHAALKALGFVG